MQAVEHAATLASALQADLHIACAVRPPIEVASMNPMGAAFLPNWAEAANAEAADLLVLGSKGMKGPARFLLGSVPNRCAHHAHCSVLIVRTI